MASRRVEEMEQLAQGSPVSPALDVGSPTAVDLNGDGKREYVAVVRQVEIAQVALLVLTSED